MCQRTHDPVFPIDGMGAWQQMTEGLAPQNICSGSGGEFVSRVGLAAFEPLGSERAAEPVDVIAHPPFEPTEWQIVPFPTDCCPTSGKRPVPDCHLMPHGLVTLGEKLVPDPLVHRNTSLKIKGGIFFYPKNPRKYSI